MRCMERKPHLLEVSSERGHVSDLYFIYVPEADHPAPIVNMVEIKQFHGSSLSTIPEEHTWSLVGTHTTTVSDDEDFPPFPPGFGGRSSRSVLTALPETARPPRNALNKKKETSFAHTTEWQQKTQKMQPQTQQADVLSSAILLRNSIW